jgi:hypothetical protein
MSQENVEAFKRQKAKGGAATRRRLRASRRSDERG